MSKYLEGVINIDNEKKAFCQVGEKSYYIAPKFLNRALVGDKVLIKVKDEFGFVQKVIKRSTELIRGQIELSPKGYGFFKPWSNKYHRDFFIPNTDLNGAKAGDIVEIQVKDWPKKFRSPIAMVKKTLFPATSEQHLIYKLNLPTQFPEEVLFEVKQLIDNFNINDESENRIDLRHLKVFSIDPLGSKDLDDALSFETTEHGYRVGIHIADLSAWIKPGTALDQEAYKRGCTVYLPQSNVPMIPRNLCENLCSLLPNTDRLAISIMVNLDREWNIKDYYIFRSIINNRYQFTYEEANEQLQQPSSEYYYELNQLYSIGQKIRYEFFPDELDLNLTDWKWEFNENNEPVKIKLKNKIPTQDLIQSWMLLANSLVTKKIESLGIKSWIYRVHPSIEDEKIEHLKIDLKQIGLTWNDVESKATNIQRLIKESKIVSDITLRKFRPASYSPQRLGHFAIGTMEYAHFTSPIRRYPDLMIHRILLNALDNKPIYCGDLYKECEHLTSCEKMAEEAERTAQQTNILKFVQDIKYPLNAQIINLSKKGIYVRTELMVEGIIPAKELKAIWVEEERRWINDNDWKLGDFLNVDIKNLDWNRREIIFSIN